ncbi:thiamine-phosphate kinase [Kangiella sediminilitoris]|uniref:Thiamine-monophosphate kinase n=1 Tax=Kangiella sediminilitoris TaxID=1144748 RepID=A0A1B3BD04_9GAMM|nr:thiamine-phosphate kinase [Kangiella sediminilitoris]AOE50655.1 Thiamine-monophosphate kinase [Kangiella sediminilitoris]
MAEFDLIEQYFNFHYDFSSNSADKKGQPSVVKGIGDDCAIFNIPDKFQLVTSTDTLVSDVHFFSNLQPELIAYKALAVNVSDLAAMGAKPLAFTLSITLPEVSERWLSDFSKGLKSASEKFQIPLVGGDTTQGPLTINITAYGTVKQSRLLRRDKAQVGDDIWVTGYLGEAAAALDLSEKALGGRDELTEAENNLWQSLATPKPPVKFATKLAKFAECGLDISDGLMADLGHILKQSQCGANLDVEFLPLSDSLVEVVGIEQARQFALNGGDDYQLCFTAKSQHRNKILNLGERYKVNTTRVGKVTEGDLIVQLEGEAFQPTRASWQHFNQ